VYNLLGSGMDRFVPSSCDFFQYADYIVVYSSHHVLQTACALSQMVFSILSVLFSLFELTISYKVRVGIVLLKALVASGLDQAGG
jgi:hypothetical protein